MVRKPKQNTYSATSNLCRLCYCLPSRMYYMMISRLHHGIMYRCTVAVVPAIFIESSTLHAATIHKCWLVAENKLLLIHLPEYEDQRCSHVEEVS